MPTVPPPVFFNTTSEWPRQPDERCRPAWTNRPPPSGEDGYVYPAGTASSVRWRVTPKTWYRHRFCYISPPYLLHIEKRYPSVSVVYQQYRLCISNVVSPQGIVKYIHMVSSSYQEMQASLLIH